MMVLCVQDVKAACDFAAVILAILAAAAWFVASRHPVGGNAPTPYMPADRNNPLWEEIASHNRKILRGAKWNQIAVVLAGFSSFSTFLSWFIPRLIT